MATRSLIAGMQFSMQSESGWHSRTRAISGTVLLAGVVSAVAGALILLAEFSPLWITIPGVQPGAAPAVAMPEAPGPQQVLDPATVTAPSPSPDVSPATPPAQPQAGIQQPRDGYSFELHVPAVGYRALVYEGVSLKVLATGPGHYPGTPWPGQPGNVGVAGHNAFFMSFNRLHTGDRVEIRTEHGLYTYQITSIKVVEPNDRTVLAPTSTNQLTLTTCYPLWAGAAATQRLIFVAREIGAVG